MVIIETVAGLALLVVGGDLLVRGAATIAGRLGVSPLLIGLTLLGFGTSMPELFTSVTAALEGAPGIAVGNVVGSNIANILLILGIAAVVRPLSMASSDLRRDGIVTLMAALACVALVLYGTLPRLAGLVLLIALLAYLVVAYRGERSAGAAASPVDPPMDPAQHSPEQHSPEQGSPGLRGWLLPLGFTIGGFAAIFLGAEWLVAGAIAIAREAGVSDSLVGLTLVAVGTSLPELVTSTMAALRRQGEIAIGNVLGSNIYNVLAILGATALVQPIPVPGEIVGLDVWVMLAATLALLALLAAARIGRRAGGLLLGSYLAYLVALALRAA